MMIDQQQSLTLASTSRTEIAQRFSDKFKNMSDETCDLFGQSGKHINTWLV